MTDRNRIQGMVRREALGLMAAGGAILMTGAPARAAQATKPIGGIMPVSTTPYTATGEIDHEDLAKTMKFYESCGANGSLWPLGGGDAPLLSKEERMKGFETIANACRPLKMASVLSCQGADQATMLEYVTKAESLNPDGIAVQPPANKPFTDDEAYNYFAPVAKITKRPIIMTNNPQGFPSLATNLRLAKEFPNFGYVKEEGNPIPAHIRADIAAKPGLRMVLSTGGGPSYLYDLALGVDGQATAQGAYADLSVAILKAYRAGKKDLAAEIFSKMLLMMNCETFIPGTQRYVFHKRGVFKSLMARRAGAGAAGKNYTVVEVAQLPVEKAEIELRFAQLKPYLATGL